ncbi:MAG: hypothetical protein HY365_03215 [Candidatus Aenigmarchaeota archaeon]|nr:hypothetical protein [Candidatus Aenigmarchaeota archaeon]
MHSAVKMFMGLLLFAAGMAWYAGPLLGFFEADPVFHIRPTYAFALLFSGLFGLALIFFGLVIAWVEYEDLRWAKRKKE